MRKRFTLSLSHVANQQINDISLCRGKVFTLSCICIQILLFSNFLYNPNVSLICPSNTSVYESRSLLSIYMFTLTYNKTLFMRKLRFLGFGFGSAKSLIHSATSNTLRRMIFPVHACLYQCNKRYRDGGTRRIHAQPRRADKEKYVN